MEAVYMLTNDDDYLGNIIIYLTLQDAVASSIENPGKKVVIFKKSDDGYIPTYKYYKNGKLYN